MLSAVNKLSLCKETACCVHKSVDFAGRATKAARQLTTFFPSQAVASCTLPDCTPDAKWNILSQNHHISALKQYKYSFPKDCLALCQGPNLQINVAVHTFMMLPRWTSPMRFPGDSLLCLCLILNLTCSTFMQLLVPDLALLSICDQSCSQCHTSAA